MGIVDDARNVAEDVGEAVDDTVEEAEETVDETVSKAKKIVSEGKDKLEEATGQDLDGDGETGDTSGNGEQGTGSGPGGGGSSGEELSGEEARDFLRPGQNEDKVEDLKEQVEEEGLDEVEGEEELETAINQNTGVAPPGQQERAEAFVRNVQAEQTAERQEQQIQEQVQRLEQGEGGRFKLRTGEGETETVTREQAISRLENAQEDVSGIAERARRNQEVLVNPPERQSFEIPQSMKGEVGPSFQSAPTDMPGTTQFASGTNIREGYSQGSGLSDPEFRRDLKNQLELRGDAATLAFTSTGFEAPFTLVDPDTSLQGRIEADQRAALDRGGFQDAVEFAGSPFGLIATGGLGKAAGAGIKGLQATGVGTGRAASALGTGAKAAGAGLVGLQAGKGLRNIGQGKITTGGGQLLQVTAETGAITKGFRSASQKYGKRLGPTTRVEPDGDTILRQVQTGDDGQLLIGSGEMTARTPIVQRVPFRGGDPGDLKQVDEATSTASYRVVADEEGAEAQGRIVDEIGGEETEKGFQSFSTVVAREGENKVLQFGDNIQSVSLGENEIATRNILRTEEEGRLLREFDDTATTSVVRKEGETPVDEIRGFRAERLDEPVEVQDAMGREEIVTRLERDVLDEIRKGNLDAKRVEFSTYTRQDGQEIIGESSNLVLNRGRGGQGPGSFSGGGQGLEFQGRYGEGFVQETQRQVQATKQFGARSREAAREKLESGSQLQGFSSQAGGGTGGQQAEGFQAGNLSEFELQSRGQQVQAPETGAGKFQLRRERAGERLRTEIGVSSVGGSGLRTRGNTEGLRQERRSRPGEIGLNDVETGLGQENRQRAGLGQGLEEDVSGRTAVGQLQTPGLGTGLTTRLAAVPVQRLRTRTRLRTGLKNVSVTTPATRITPRTGGLGGFPIDLEADLGGKGLKGEGNLEIPGQIGKDVDISILSANRAELLTGKKTFRLDSDDVTEYSQSPFSGGLQTVQEQNLGKRTYRSDKEVDFY